MRPSGSRQTRSGSRVHAPRMAKAVEILTPFSDENRNADLKAFAAFMKHLRASTGSRTRS